MGAIIARLFSWRRGIEGVDRESSQSDNGSTDSLLHYEQVASHLHSPSPLGGGGGDSETDESLIESLPLDILLK